MGTLSSRLVEHLGGKTFNKFYSYLELCIASISFSTVFLRTGIEETVSMVFSPYNFTFTVLFCKQIIKKGKKKKKKGKIICSAQLNQPTEENTGTQRKINTTFIFGYLPM